jgi:hypothetical protein
MNQHPSILEKFPLNTQESSQSPLQIMEQYLRRSNVEKSFGPVLDAIKSAYQRLYPDQEPVVPQGTSKLDQEYTKDKWKTEYLPLAEKIFAQTKEIDENTLLYNKSGYSPNELRNQVKSGLNLLLKREGIGSQDLSKEELIGVISKSIYLLDVKVSHLFYDRLHFTAALTSTDTIETKDGPLPVQDLFIGILESFQEVNETNALAAEQFYIRLMMMDEVINKPRK